MPSHSAESGPFARGCAERLRSIEGRLDYSCGGRWQAQLDVCEDLATVARLLTPLQQRCGALPDADSSWLARLGGMGAEELDAQASELTKMLTTRLNELVRLSCDWALEQFPSTAPPLLHS